MLKILEKKFSGEVLRGYWKRCVALVIVLRNKWRDPFFRAEAIVIFLQIGFAGTIMIFAYVLFNYLHESILKTLISGIMQSINAGDFEGGKSLIDSLQLIKSQNFLLFSTILVSFATIFTFLIAKLTLRPAKNALDSQKRFISNIAHELRTPLSVIKTNSEVALMDNNMDPAIIKMVKDNIEELDRMADIINNTLSFDKMLRPESIKFSNTNLGLIIDSAVKKLKNLADKKHLDITIKKVSPHIVWGNAVALEQVITNLLKNAVTYTSQNGHITIRVGPDYYGNVILHIEDTGIGIAKKDLMHIFEPFYRAERSRHRGAGSSGLGLSIAGELVKMHSGTLTIRSLKNKGTTVIVTLPYGKDINPADSSIDVSDLNEISIRSSKNKK